MQQQSNQAKADKVAAGISAATDVKQDQPTQTAYASSRVGNDTPMMIKIEDQTSRETFKGLQIYQSPEEIQELLLQELENLFDRPCLIPVQVVNQAPGAAPAQTPFKVGLEKDKANTFLVTNPQAIFKVFQKDQFLALPEQTQCTLLERLDDILLKCAHNSLILTDHIVQASPSQLIRISQTAINELKNKASSKANESGSQGDPNQSPTVLKSPPSRHQPALSYSSHQDHDLILQIIHLGLKTSFKRPVTAKKLVELVRKLTLGRRFFRCHIEFIYQYLKVKCSQLTLQGKCAKALSKVDTAIKMLQNMFEFKYEPGPSNYFYFSGYLSGLQVNTRNIQSFDMQKGFAAAMWFQIQENMLQDEKSLPVLFNCFVQGAGGFECYFKNRQIYYRSLGKNYTPPTMESNGFCLGEITPKKWYFLAIDHEKPFMSRPVITYIINEKQGTQFMDYPSIQKNQKVSMMILCQNFVGLMSSFLFFKETLGGNAKKLAQLANSPPFEYGLHSQQQFNQLKPEVFDKFMLEKLYVLYTPDRTSNKTVYDCVDMRDGDLMINSGVCHAGPKSKLFFTGGLNSLLPFLELISGIATLNRDSEQLQLDQVFNEYLKLIVHVLSGRSYSTTSDQSNFFTQLFHLLQRLPHSAVNPQTVQTLADIRFHIGDVTRMQEEYFRCMMMSSDWWVNTDNQEVLNEYWLFVKAIYQQAPKAYNQMFSIQSLVDLMVKISEIKDNGHCCEFHRDTYQIFYHGQTASQQETRKQITGNWVMLERASAIEQTEANRPSSLKRGNDQNLTKSGQGRIHNIEKYLAPIAGVLEGILTSGGNEVLEHIKCLAWALAVKTSPCFHLQVLKLIKVLLLDQKENHHCASPADFAAHFLQAKGLQVLLNLCKTSSFDVKSMCLKLIDVLSLHTSLIKMSIGPDVITYLCSIILPQSVIDQASRFNHHQGVESQHQMMIEDETAGVHSNDSKDDKKRVQQFEVMEDTEEEQSKTLKEPFQVAISEGDHSKKLQSTPQFEDSQELENQMNQLLAKESPLIIAKSSKKQAAASFAFAEDQEGDEDAIMEDDEAIDMTNPRVKDERFSIGAFIANATTHDAYMQEEDDDILIAKPPPPAPKNRANKMTFAFGDDDEEDENENDVDEDQDFVPKPVTKQPQKNMFFSQKKKKQIIITEDPNKDEEEAIPKKQDLLLDDDESQKQKGFKSDNEDLIDTLEQEAQMIDDNPMGSKKMQFMNTQKIPSSKNTSKPSKPKAKAGVGMSSIAKFRGKTLDLAQDEDRISGKPKKVMGTLNLDLMEGSKANFAPPPPPKRAAAKPSFSSIKGEDQNNFANENVMSKSNLRDRKQFLFGGDDDSSNSSKNSDQEEEKKRSEPEQQQEEEQFQSAFGTRKFGGPPKLGKQPPSMARRGPPRLQLDEDPPMESVAVPEHVHKSPIESATRQTITGPKKKLFLGGTTGATSDDYGQDRVPIEEVKMAPSVVTEEIEEEEKEEPSNSEHVIRPLPGRQSMQPGKPKVKLLAIDTEEINKQFTFGGEKGEIMMSEDEELRKLEDEIEYFAGMCIAAMNRKKPTDPIRYEGGREKISFEQQYLQNEEGQEGDQPTQKAKQSKKDFNALKSVRGIKKIVLQDKGNDQGSLMNTYNTINEEMSGDSESSQQSSSRSNRQQDINFPGLLSSSLVEPYSNGAEEALLQDADQEMQIDAPQDLLVVETQDQGMTFAQLPGLNFDENEEPQRSSDGLLVYNNPIFSNIQQNDQENLHLEHQTEEVQEFEPLFNKEQFFTKELENLYTSCLEWIIQRAPSSLYENIVIDECDKVTNFPAIQLLMNLVTNSNNMIRQRALTDLEMLSKWDSNNGVQMMMLPQFHSWLLDLLMPYQEILSKNQGNLSEQAMAVYDIGCKLHTHLLKNSCINSEEEAYKKINFVARWPQIVHNQVTQNIKGRQEKDVETAQILSRILICQLITHIKDELQRTKPVIGKGAQTPTWHNLIFISSLVEEIVMSSSTNESAPDYNFERNYDYNNQPLLKWIQDDGYLLYLKQHAASSEPGWADQELLETLTQTFDFLYTDPVMIMVALRPTNDASYLYYKESIHSALLMDQSPSSDNFNGIVKILMHDMSPYKSNGSYGIGQTNTQAPQQKPAMSEKKPKKGIIGNVFGKIGGGNSSKESSLATSSPPLLDTSQAAHDPAQATFMQNIINLLCIGSSQSDSISNLQVWLDRLERFTKFLILASETWKSTNLALYNQVQKKLSESITFAITFLFNEIQAQKSPKYRNSLNMLQSGAWNHQETIRVTDLYNNALKNVILFLINVLQTKLSKMQSIVQDSHITASQLLFSNILVVKFQQETKSPLRGLLHGNFQLLDDHFPKCFLTEDWQVVFLWNENIKQMVKWHLNAQQLQAFRKRREEYAYHYNANQMSNERTKEDIFIKMEVEANNVMSTISGEEYERKNQVAIVIENFIRNQGHEWSTTKSGQIGGTGMWKCDPTRMKLDSLKLGDGTRPLMKDCYGPKKFEYFENMPELEKKIFGHPISSLDHLNSSSQDFDILLLTDYPYLLDPKAQQAQQSINSTSPAKRNPKLEILPLTGVQSYLNDKQYLRKNSDEDDFEDINDDDEDEAQVPFKMAFQTQPAKIIDPDLIMRPSNLDFALNFGNEVTNPNQVVSFLSRILSLRERKEMRKRYVGILKEIIYEAHLKDLKFKEIISEMRCEYFKPFYKRTGSISLTSHQIIFFDDLLSEQDLLSLGPQSIHYREGEPTTQITSTDNIFFFKYTKRDDEMRYKIISLPDIKELQRRRWLGRKTALEVFLMSGKSVMLNFTSSDDRDTFAKKIIRQRGQRCYNLKYHETLDPKKILKKKEYTERWMQWKMSNFEYISLINQLAGRSYQDLSQYPIFPWIFIDYLSQQVPDFSIQFNQLVGAPQGFRDLNKNMQLQGSAERQAEFKRKYEDADSFESIQDRYHCGSHYSNPGIVLHYMSRVSPNLDALIQLHGKNLDSPDRGFHSIHDSIQSALTDHANVRELIPEFFFSPELFINQNRINFGKKQEGTIVDDVILPPWAQNDPYLFVIYLREAFESQYVSQAICGWVDYIFGFKQRDVDAERALNTYSRLTYEDGVDMEAIIDPMVKQGYQEQIYNYGQTPSQLFSKQKHPQKLARSQALKYNLVVDTLAKIKVYKPVATQPQLPKGQQTPQQIVISQEAILKAKFIDDSTIVGLSKDGNLTYFFWVSRPHEMNPNTPFTCCEDKKRKFDNSTKFGVGLDGQDRSIKRFDFPLLVMNTQKCVLKGGLWSGQIHICPIEGISSESQSILNGHQSTVTSIVCTSNERTVITGSKSGDVIVWAYTFGSVGCGAANWNIRSHKSDHQSQVSFIFISEDMNMYLTCSLDGSVCLYNLWTDAFIRAFHHPKLSPLHSAVLTASPLAACCFFSREDHHWYSYSLNNPGHMLEKQREECSHMIQPLVIKDSYHMDRLVYGTEKGYLIFRQLPLLKQVKKLQVSVSYPVLSLIVSPDRRFLLVGCGDSGLNVVTEPSINQAVILQTPNSASLGSNTTAQTGLLNSTMTNVSMISMTSMNSARGGSSTQFTRE